MPLSTVDILGVRVQSIAIDDLHRELAGYIDGGGRARILHANVNGLNLAAEHVWMRELYNQAELVFCDGAGVILGARLLGKHIPERITFADWMWKVGEFAAQRGYSFYFLGAYPGVSRAAADQIVRRYPTLKIAGTHHGYFRKSPGHPQNEAVLRDISRTRPSILILGMGMPMQEKWLLENWDRLDCNVVMTGGAVFDYLSGNLRRAPRWMNDHSLEWLGRLIIEPRRLWRRYMVGNPTFLARVLRQRLTSDIGR